MTNFDLWLISQKIDKASVSTAQLSQLKQRFIDELVSKKGDKSQIVNK